MENADRRETGQVRRRGRGETKVKDDYVGLSLGQDGPLGLKILHKVLSRQPAHALIGAEDRARDFWHRVRLESGGLHYRRPFGAEGKDDCVSLGAPGFGHGQANG